MNERAGASELCLQMPAFEGRQAGDRHQAEDLQALDDRRIDAERLQMPNRRLFQERRYLALPGAYHAAGACLERREHCSEAIGSHTHAGAEHCRKRLERGAVVWMKQCPAGAQRKKMRSGIGDRMEQRLPDRILQIGIGEMERGIGKEPARAGELVADREPRAA